MKNAFSEMHFSSQNKQVQWQGYLLHDSEELDSFMKGEVASRLNDEEGEVEFRHFLEDLSATGFENENLLAVLTARIREERPWAIGEAIAEAWLKSEETVIWPWNMERDKRNAYASLPGADLVGFVFRDGKYHLVLGEVKTSGDKKIPPEVMYGRGGMIHQLENVSTDLSAVIVLFRWLYFRCVGTPFELHYKESIMNYLESGNKDIQLYGILVRDTQVNALDLANRANLLSRSLEPPTMCNLIALYFPFPISQFPDKVKRELAS